MRMGKRDVARSPSWCRRLSISGHVSTGSLPNFPSTGVRLSSCWFRGMRECVAAADSTRLGRDRLKHHNGSDWYLVRQVQRSDCQHVGRVDRGVCAGS